MTQNPKYRYPGVKPFEVFEQALFFGRHGDSERLLSLIRSEKIVVLFGKSGYGKSSLINAGVLPKVSLNMTPLLIRFGSRSTFSKNISPLTLLRQKISEIKNGVETNQKTLNKLKNIDSLWLLLKRKQRRDQENFVFIFDQFEEFFTYSIVEQNEFKVELSELHYTDIPQTVRDQSEDFDLAEQDFLASTFNVKIIFSIRSDRISLLDSMQNKLPTILNKRYELKGLTMEQAHEAIEQPALAEGNFISPKFVYNPDALEIILQKLSASKGNQEPTIEAFQLQILCEKIETDIVANHIPDYVVNIDYIDANIDGIFEGYYQRLIERLDPKVQKAAEILIEEGLIYEDTLTGEARRLSVDGDVLVQQFNEQGITHAVLHELENQFLIRREASILGGYNYEISHDTLIAPILKAKSERNKKEAEKKARAEAEKISLEAQKKLRRLLRILSIFVLAITIMGLFTIYAFNQKWQAEQAKIKANKATKRAEDAELRAEKTRDTALIEKRKAILARDSVFLLNEKLILSDIEVLSNEINQILSSPSNCPSRLTINKLNTLYLQGKNYPRVRSAVKKINNQIINAPCPLFLNL